MIRNTKGIILLLFNYFYVDWKSGVRYNLNFAEFV